VQTFTDTHVWVFSFTLPLSLHNKRNCFTLGESEVTGSKSVTNVNGWKDKRKEFLWRRTVCKVRHKENIHNSKTNHSGHEVWGCVPGQTHKKPKDTEHRLLVTQETRDLVGHVRNQIALDNVRVRSVSVGRMGVWILLWWCRCDKILKSKVEGSDVSRPLVTLGLFNMNR
jgi:hypothetical protein